MKESKQARFKRIAEARVIGLFEKRVNKVDELRNLRHKVL